MKKSFCAILLILGAFAGVQAGTVWDGGGANSSWGTAANWNGDALPAFNGTDALNFGTAFGSGTGMTLDADRNISSLTLTSAVNIVIDPGSPAGKLTLASGNLTSSGPGSSAIAKNQTHNEDIILGASGIFNAGGAASSIIAINGGISDGGNGYSITKSGTRYLTLAGSNSFGGGVIVSAGILDVNHNNALGTGPLRFTGLSSLRSNGKVVTNAVEFDTSSDITFGVGSVGSSLSVGKATLKNTNVNLKLVQFTGLANAWILDQGIAESQTNSALTVSGDSTRCMVVNGNSTFSGTLTLGALSGNLCTFQAAGTMATTNVVLNNAYLQLGAHNPVGSGKLTINGLGNTRIGCTAGRKNLDNEIELKGNLPFDSNASAVDFNANGGTFTLLTDVGISVQSGSLEANSPKFWNGIRERGGSFGIFLSGNNGRALVMAGESTYTGPTQISNTLMFVQNDNALPTNTALILCAGSTVDSTLQVNGYAIRIGSLEGFGAVRVSAGTLTIGGTSNTLYSGYLTGAAASAGPGSLVKDGTGVLRLTANTNVNYTSGTTIKGGTLQVDGLMSVATGTVDVTGGLLCGTGRINRAVNVQPGGSIGGGFGTNLIGALTTGNLGFSNTASLVWAVDPTTNSVLVSTNALTQSGACTVKVYNLGRTIATTDVFPVIRYAGALNGFVPANWTIDLTASPTVTASRSARLYSSSGVIYLTGLQSPASPSGTVVLIR